jgi:hypothetical protein
VGVCGDWLTSPSLEGAAHSGIALARHIGAVDEGRRKARAEGQQAGARQPEPDVGLDCGFKAVAGPASSAIGSVA